MPFATSSSPALADASRRPSSTDLGISDETLVASVQPQLKFQKERGGDLTVFSPRAGGMAHHVGSEKVSQEWSRICNDLIHRICRLLPDNFVAGGPAAAVPGRIAEELHPRARAHRERARLRRREPQPGPFGRHVDRPAAHRPALVSAVREAVRARRAGDDPRVVVVQPELPPHRRALHQRRHHRLHAAHPGEPLQGFPDAALRHPARRRRGAVPLGALPRPRAGHGPAAARRAPAEERVLRHLRVSPARHRAARQGDPGGQHPVRLRDGRRGEGHRPDDRASLRRHQALRRPAEGPVGARTATRSSRATRGASIRGSTGSSRGGKKR